MPAPSLKPRIVPLTTGSSFVTSTKNTGMSQRETLEAIILNLSEALDISEVLKVTSARGAEFYRPSLGGMSFQSATNTIFDLSKMVQNK